MKRSHGFTVVELIVVILFLGAVATLLLVQRGDLEATQRDTQRKTAVNAMYYNLEEVYYKEHKYYPAKIGSKTLPAMDPELFTDPDGIKLGELGSDYTYTGLNCTDNKCKAYELSAKLEREDKYVKKNP